MVPLKKPITAYLILLLSLLNRMGAQDKSKPCPEPTAASDSKFHPGQVWQYNTRPDEKGSTLTILKVESLPKLGLIIHIRVDKVRLGNCTGGPEHVEHMPFKREAIDRRVTKLLKEGEIPPFQPGYNEWRKTCAGAFTITVAEAVATVEEAFRKGGCPPAKG